MICYSFLNPYWWLHCEHLPTVSPQHDGVPGHSLTTTRLCPWPQYHHNTTVSLATVSPQHDCVPGHSLTTTRLCPWPQYHHNTTVSLATAVQETRRRQPEGREEERKFWKSTTDPQPAATVRLDTDTAQKQQQQKNKKMCSFVDKMFIATNICPDKHKCVAPKLLSR